jgi:uncharacterized protein (TIGR03437 family)
MIKKILGVALGVFVLAAAAAVPARAQFVVNPTSLTFAVSPGSNPTQQLVFISTNGANVNFTLSGSSSPPWLTYGSISSNTTPANFSVGANSSGLPVGIYTGSITVTDVSGGGNAPVTIPLTLVVSSGPVIVASPTALVFTQTIVGQTPSPQTVSVSNPGPGTLVFTAAASAAGNWLSVTPTSGTAATGSPATLTVSVNPNSLVQGTYSGTITLSSSNASDSPITIGVTISVPAGPVLAVSPPSMNFNATAGGASPGSQQIFVGDTGIGSLGFTVLASTTSGGSWLSVTPVSGVAPPTNQLTASVNIAGLAAGNYTGSIVVQSNAIAGNSPFTIPVTLEVAAEAGISISPASLSFTGTVGGSNPASQTFSLSNTGGSILNYGLTATTTSGGPWLSVANAGSLTLSGSTSTSLPVSVNLSGLAAGTYSGKIIVSSNFATNSPQSLNVNLTVNPGSAAGLSVSPSALTFEAVPFGSAPNPQTIAVSAAISGASFTATATTNSGGSWLSVTPSGTTPGAITVTASNGSLGAGTYTGSVSVTSGSSNPVTVPVTLNVVSGQVILVSPPSLTFSSAPGTNPAPQTLALSVFGTGSLSFAYTATVATTSGGNWLSVSPASGSGSGQTPLTVSANVAGLSVGTYQGTVIVASTGTTNSPVSVGVTLTVNGAPNLALSASTVQMTTALPATLTQQVALTTTGSSTVNFSLSTNTVTGGNWLSATTGSTSSTPATITVTANTSGLVAGSYQGTVTIASSGATNSPLTLNVQLAVSAPQFSSAGVVGGASYTGATVTAGGIVSLFGTGLSSAIAFAGSLPLATILNNTQVMVNGATAAPLFYVSPTQINFEVPWEVLGQPQISIVVTSGGVPSIAETIPLAPLGPGIFTINSAGTGQGAIQIANSNPAAFAAPIGSIPGAVAQPVTRGQYITIYCTGLGNVTPQPPDGTAAGSSTTLQPVTVTLGGSLVASTSFDFAGLAPGFVGLYQVNVQVPATAATGPTVSLYMTIGGVQSNTVTIAVQ